VSRAAALMWLRIAAITAVAWATLVLVEPPRPSVGLPWPVALIAGCCVGVALVTVIVRRAPAANTSEWLRPVPIARNAMLAVWAANEEILWRRLLLGEALRGGAVFALAASTLAFAAIHRARRRTHVATGAAFGGCYLASGSLLAPIAAHWAYNALLAADVKRRRMPAVETAT
jgi:membrane protease YdiL (CAAX protease family)